MLVFPELGKGTDQPTLSTNLFELNGQASLCSDIKWRHVIIQVTTCSFVAGSMKYCHFSIPVTAQGDWIRTPPHKTHVREIVWEWLGGWRHRNSRQLSVTSMRQDTCNGGLISIWKFAEQLRTPVFLQIQNAFAILSSVLNLSIGRAKYCEFKWRLIAALCLEVLTRCFSAEHSDWLWYPPSFKCIRNWMKCLERESHYLASSGAVPPLRLLSWRVP